VIGKLKDAVLSKGSKTAANSLMKEYGRMLRLDLDSAKKCISMEVMLEGEAEPLHINISCYELSEEEGEYFLKLYGVETSRTWINTFAAAYLEGKAFKIPAEYAKFLKVVV
jgi:hypothetical protein